MARALALPLLPAEHQGRGVVLEGGAIDVNGAGSLLTTEECLLSPDIQVRNPGLGRASRRQSGTAHPHPEAPPLI